MKTQKAKTQKIKHNIDDYAIKALDGTILPLRNIWQICHDAYGTEYVLEPQIYALVSFNDAGAYECFTAQPYEGDWVYDFCFDKDKQRFYILCGDKVYYKYVLKEFNFKGVVNIAENEDLSSKADEIGEIMDKIVRPINEKIIKIIDKCGDTFDEQYQEWLKNNKDFLLKLLYECGLNKVIDFPEIEVETKPKTFVKI